MSPVDTEWFSHKRSVFVFFIVYATSLKQSGNFHSFPVINSIRIKKSIHMPKWFFEHFSWFSNVENKWHHYRTYWRICKHFQIVFFWKFHFISTKNLKKNRLICIQTHPFSRFVTLLIAEFRLSVWVEAIRRVGGRHFSGGLTIFLPHLVKVRQWIFEHPHTEHVILTTSRLGNEKNPVTFS